MQPRLPRLLYPPTSSDYEQAQKAKFLHVALLVVLMGSLVIGWINLRQNATGLAVFLFVIGGFCLVGLKLNHEMHLRAVAFLLFSLVFLVTGYNLIDGAALHDPGVAAYPIFIIFSSFFFGKKAVPFSALASIASVGLIYWLAVRGFIKPSDEPTINRVLILSVLYVATAWLVWAIRNIWDETLMQLSQSYELTLQGWARALEYRDGETEGHTRRTTELSVALARKLGMSKEEIVHVRRGSYMHDIGKMAIPDRILLKPGPLDDDEMELMKRHPAIACDIISNIPFLQPAVAIPYSHHESWDGSGYPQGLKGAEIPLIARIFTVVDQWDALSSDRPYRTAWPAEKIRSYLLENAGKIYDPQIVMVFLAMLDEREARKFETIL